MLKSNGRKVKSFIYKRMKYYGNEHRLDFLCIITAYIYHSPHNYISNTCKRRRRRRILEIFSSITKTMVDEEVCSFMIFILQQQKRMKIFLFFFFFFFFFLLIKHTILLSWPNAKWKKNFFKGKKFIIIKTISFFMKLWIKKNYFGLILLALLMFMIFNWIKNLV